MANNQALASKKSDLLQVFFNRFDWRSPLDLAPVDSTFQILARVRARRSTEITPLNRLTSAADTRDVATDHVRIKGTNGDLAIGPARTSNKRNSDCPRNNDAFNRSVKILMYAHVLISCADERGEMWRPLQSAAKHITAVENHAHAAARAITGLDARLAEAEMAVRREWREIAQAEPAFSLATIIELVRRRHSMWPATLELKQ